MGEFPSKENQFSSERQPETNGRPLGKSFKTILEKLLDLEASDEEKTDEEIKKMFPDGRVTKREILMTRLLIRALRDPDSKSMERLMNRVDGKPVETVKQKLELSDEAKILIAKEGDKISLTIKKPVDTGSSLSL